MYGGVLHTESVRILPDLRAAPGKDSIRSRVASPPVGGAQRCLSSSGGEEATRPPTLAHTLAGSAVEHENGVNPEVVLLCIGQDTFIPGYEGELDRSVRRTCSMAGRRLY